MSLVPSDIVLLRCQHPSTRPRRRRRVRKATKATALALQSRDSPVLPPSLSSVHVSPPPRPTPSIRDRPHRPSHWRPPSRSLCRRRGCQEPVHLECTTRHCNFHCHSDRRNFHQFLSGNGVGGDCSVDEDVVIPSFLRPSRCAQLNTRRLWHADGTVHVAFHALSTLLLRRSRASKRLMLRTLPASLMTNPIVMMGHPVLVAPRQSSCSTSQSLPPPSQDSLTPSEFAGAWLVGFFVFVLTMLLMGEWMPISALVLGRNWLRLCATHSGYFLVFQLSLAATLLSGGLHSTWERHRDRPVFPFIHELSLWNDLTRATHTVGAALDLVFTSVALRAGSFHCASR